MEFKIEKLLHENKYKEKIITHKYNIKELWDMIQRSNLSIYRVEKEAEIQTKGIGTYSMKL
jgi:hypothetical protein